jgi:hypothetical protein
MLLLNTFALNVISLFVEIYMTSCFELFYKSCYIKYDDRLCVICGLTELYLFSTWHDIYVGMYMIILHACMWCTYEPIICA